MTGRLKSGLQISAIVLMPLISPINSAHAEWTGGLEAGTQLGSGENPTLRFYARNDTDPLSHYVYLDWTRETGGQSYRLGYNPVFHVSRSLYSFGKFSIEEDADSIIDRQLDALVGLGNHIHRNRTSLLTLEAGAGGKQIEFTGNADEQTEGFLYLGARYKRVLSKLLQLNTIVDSRTGESQDTLDAEVGISFKLSSNTALKYAYRYERTDFDDSNLETQVNKDSFFTLTYGF